MIKLKSLLTESWEVVVGFIGMDGRIDSKETKSTHIECGFNRGKCWRYNPYNHNVYWSGDDSEHDKDDEFTVENHLLKKYGYSKISSHIPLESGDPDEFQNNWMIAHGHKI